MKPMLPVALLVAVIAWGESPREITIVSTADGTQQAARAYFPDSAEAIPLVVALHSWSGDYKQDAHQAVEQWCVEQGWAYIHPDFRGPNNRPEATGSPLVVQDILDAVAHARQQTTIDPAAIYLIGASGGGYTALMMAGRYPEHWAGVFAWVPITDLTAWYYESSKANNKYAEDIIASCGGVPGASPEVDREYRDRSPLTWLTHARGVPLHLNAGIRDGHEGSVPISHSLRAFNAVADDKDKLAEEDIRYLVEKAAVPEHLAMDIHDPPYGNQQPLFRRRSGNAELTLFDGGHTSIVEVTLSALAAADSRQRSTAAIPREQEQIRAFCIDFNWGPEGFATPGMYAQAKAREHLEWYRALGVNTIQTFCVSCPGYAWYKSKVAPTQPGMQGEFLKELVALGHEADMRVMGYFCIGANSYWDKMHPELSHAIPNAISIPFTLPYLDYLEQVIVEAVSETGIDGFMIDWVYNASHLYPDRDYAWLECEKEMYLELFGEPFPGNAAMDTARIHEFNKRATERCWDRIRKAAKSANPDCILWLTCYDLDHPMLKDSRMLREVDWLMNEHPDPEKLAATHAQVGAHTRIIQCISGWGDQHNAEKVINDPRFSSLGLYGFARPDLTTTLPPDDNSGNARNIAAMRKAFNEK